MTKTPLLLTTQAPSSKTLKDVKPSMLPKPCLKRAKKLTLALAGLY